MKTIEQVLGYTQMCVDGRDIDRLFEFLPEEHLAVFGIELKDKYIGKHKARALTKKNVLAQLEKDLVFGFEKAIGQRGISAGLMYNVVRMWNWILEEGLEDFDEYPQYGLPLFKATAIKYGFPNPIGKDTGQESKYACE